MPSPVGHTLFTLSIVKLLSRKTFGNKVLLINAIIFGLLPDIDLVMILFLGFKEGGKYHQLFTHSIFFATLVFVFLVSITRNLKISFLFSFLVLMHSILDIFSVDLKPPIGVPLFSPISYASFNIGILPKIEKSSFFSLISKNNIKAVLIEILIFLPLLLIIFYATKSKKRNQVSS